MNETVASAEAWQGERSDLHGNAASIRPRTHMLWLIQTAVKSMVVNKSKGVLQFMKQSFHPITIMFTRRAGLHPAHYHNFTSLIGYRGVAYVL